MECPPHTKMDLDATADNKVNKISPNAKTLEEEGHKPSKGKKKLEGPHI